MAGIQNFTNAQQLLNIANTNTGGTFWVSVLFMTIGVLFFSFLNFGFEVSAMVSLFIGIIIGTLLLYMDLINIMYLGIVIGTELFLFIYLMFSSPKNQ